MVKLLSIILVKTFNKSRFLKFLAAHMKSAQKLDPFATHNRTDCIVKARIARVAGYLCLYYNLLLPSSYSVGC